jgi:ankyrin repeat protein
VADFHRACQFGQAAILEAMLRKGEALGELVGVRDGLQNSGLHLAVNGGHWEAVRLLLKANAAVDAENLAGRRPADLAPSPSMAALLGEFGRRRAAALSGRLPAIACVWRDDLPGLRNVPRGRLGEADELGYTAVHAAALFDRPAALRFLIGQQVEPHAASHGGITPLHEAARFSSREALRVLLFETDARAASMLASRHGHGPFAMANRRLRRLFRRFAREHGLQDAPAFDEHGVPLVHYEEVSEAEGEAGDAGGAGESSGDEGLLSRPPTVMSRDERKLQQTFAILNRLAASASPVKKSKSDDSIAAKRARPRRHGEGEAEAGEEAGEEAKRRRGRAEERKAASAKAPPLDPKYRDRTYGTTLLHRHAAKGRLREVRQLLQGDPALVRVTDNAGYSALHEAALHGHLPVVRALLDGGADIDLAAAASGDTPLHDAAENGHEEVVLYLLHAGANRILRNAQGRTADEVASEDRIRALIKSPAVASVPGPGKRTSHASSASASASASANARLVEDKSRRKPGRPRKGDDETATATTTTTPTPATNSTLPRPVPQRERKQAPPKKAIAPRATAAASGSAAKAAVASPPVPRPIAKAEGHGPLLLVSIGEPHGWFFLSPQIERLFLLGTGKDRQGSFREAHKALHALGLTDVQRALLLGSPLMKRLPELKAVLEAEEEARRRGAASTPPPSCLLEKDAVYAAFASHGLSFGNISVIYLDLQRILRSSIPLASANANATAAALHQPPKMKMKMAARKGSGAGLPPEDPSSLISGPPSLAPAVAEEERPTGG